MWSKIPREIKLSNHLTDVYQLDQIQRRKYLQEAKLQPKVNGVTYHDDTTHSEALRHLRPCSTSKTSPPVFNTQKRKGIIENPNKKHWKSTQNEETVAHFVVYSECLHINRAGSAFSKSDRKCSENHQLYSVTLTKTSLSPFDDKRYTSWRNGDTLAYGHYKINA